MILREYQQRVLNDIYAWWVRHHAVDDVGVAVMPTGSGKSIVIAELVRLLFDVWPDDHPRTLVLVPSKELCEQNAEKLRHFIPSHLSIGFYSASMGKKIPDADVIVATIGSIYKDAHLLGNIKCVIVDEIHLVNPDGKGRYRKFLRSLATYCTFRVIGFTATPFRGDGTWITCGEDPLCTGVAATVSVQELLDDGFLAPLVRPIDVLATHIDMINVSINGDYNMLEMSRRVDGVLVSAAKEAALVAKDRKKWIAFLPTVVNAQHFVDLLNAEGIHAVLVCGETPKAERAALIADFRAGRVRCLVTVLALAIGFDVPDTDCIIWLRPTISPVLYCFDTETEILTSQGWKGVNEVHIGDCALAMDVETTEGKWSRVLGVVARPMEAHEKWVTYEAPRANFRVTDNHRMIFKTKKEHSWRIETAAEMARYKDSIYMPTAVHINQSGIPLTDDELYLIGMMMTDGTWSPVQAQISQSERYPHILKRIEDTLDRMNINWKKRKVTADSNFIQRFDRWVFTISMGEPRCGNTKNGIRYLQPYMHKDLSPALMGLSKSQFLKLIEGMWDGDGVKYTTVTDWVVRGKTIVSARKICIERLQALAVMHGFTAHLRWETSGRKNPLGVITIKDQNWRSVGGAACGRRPQVEIKPPTNELVWCVETEHGTVVTRRRGKVTIMGNCQGAGRGMRIADGKVDCLWLDFSGTTERMGPVDAIKGRKKRKKSDDDDHTAPYKICDNCGERNPPRVTECTSCGYVFPPKEDEEAKKASNAAVMAYQVQVKIVDYEVSRVEYAVHTKEGKPDSLRVEYYDGMLKVASEWVCFQHSGFARAKAEGWWRKRVDVFAAQRIPANTAEALDYLHQNNRPEQEALREPVAIRVNETGKFAEIIGYSWA